MQALVVGGTGPTGPHVVRGLIERGYRTTILHRGNHESPDVPEAVRHIHADPYNPGSIAAALAAEHFDVAVAAYGRLRVVAAALVGHADRVIAIGGMKAYRPPEACTPQGYPTPVAEDFPLATFEDGQDYAARVARADVELFEHHTKGHFSACMMRYPHVYGPGQLAPREWSIVRRLLDGRTTFVLPHGGETLISHGYTLNMAHTVLLAVDHPEDADGVAFNCADSQTLSIRQWVEVLGGALGAATEILSVPDLPGHPTAPLYGREPADHRIMDTSRVSEQLGYRDLVPAPEALAATALWLARNPLPAGGEAERLLQDEFDYDYEDECIRLARRQRDELGAFFRDHHVAPISPYAPRGSS